MTHTPVRQITSDDAVVRECNFPQRWRQAARGGLVMSGMRQTSGIGNELKGSQGLHSAGSASWKLSLKQRSMRLCSPSNIRQPDIAGPKGKNMQRTSNICPLHRASIKGFGNVRNLQGLYEVQRCCRAVTATLDLGAITHQYEVRFIDVQLIESRLSKTQSHLLSGGKRPPGLIHCLNVLSVPLKCPRLGSLLQASSVITSLG